MSERRDLLLLIISGLIFSALLIRDGKVLILAIPLVVYLITGLLQAPEPMALRAQRSLSVESTTADEPVKVQLWVENYGGTVVNLRLEDESAPPMAASTGRTYDIVSLRAGDTTSLCYTLRPGRGVYSWQSIQALSADPLDLFVRRDEISAPGEILVRPSPMKIRPVPLGLPSTKLAAGPIPARKAGTGTDYWGVREYRQGDSLRRLNWRLAARHPQKWFTNEFEREEIADFGLIVDSRRLSGSEAMWEELFEHTLSAAAAIAELYLKNGNRVSLLLFGQAMSSLFPGFGKLQLNRVLQGLGSAQLGGYVPFDYLKYFPVRLFPARAQIIVLSSLDRRDLDSYARLRAYGYDVHLISPDPVDFKFRMMPKTERGNLAFRAARVERRTWLAQLIEMGVTVTDWQVDTPLESVLNGRRKHHRPRGRL